MFRGEPLALSTILTGFVLFLVTIILGLFMPDSLFTVNNFGISSAHYIAAFWGWIGFVILGAQLQFFRAIAGIRKFTPEYMRYVYYFGLVLGITSMITGLLVREELFVFIGIASYSISIIIHTYWLFGEINNKLFKFPLNYLNGSHLFLLYGLFLTWTSIIDRPLILAINFDIIHILGIGWISLNLQGAMMRILPMFTGQVIDRSMRSQLDMHFYFSFLSSLGLVIALINFYNLGIWIFGILWFISWIWVIVLLFKSIFTSGRPIDNKYTLFLFLPGLLSMALGAMIGFHTATASPILPRATHIHLNLLSGLSLIMLGAINRITSFQMYTLVYTGRKEEGVRLDDFLKAKWMKLIIPGLVLGPFMIILYFADLMNIAIFHLGITIFILHLIGYSLILLSNLVHFLKEYKNAIPYDLKPSEV